MWVTLGSENRPDAPRQARKGGGATGNNRSPWSQRLRALTATVWGHGWKMTDGELGGEGHAGYTDLTGLLLKTGQGIRHPLGGAGG